MKNGGVEREREGGKQRLHAINTIDNADDFKLQNFLLCTLKSILHHLSIYVISTLFLPNVFQALF